MKALDFETQELVYEKKKAHSSAIYTMSLHESGTVLLSGDDQGVVKMWDLRKPEDFVFCWETHEDFISGIEWLNETHFVASSGDGSISICDSQNGEMNFQTDSHDEGFLSLAVLPNVFLFYFFKILIFFL